MSKDYFLNAPLLDFMAPTIKIKQYILPNVVDDVNFITVPKMDRCTTCHLAIDKKIRPTADGRARRRAIRNIRSRSSRIPNLDTYLGGSSPHPIDRIGCTVCHDGMGQSVSFRDASHTPSTREAEGRVGEEVPLGRAARVGLPDAADEDDGGVVREVPRQEIYLPKAAKLNVAYATFERAGCYACHKTKGFDTTMKKPGPILTKIDSKLTKDWVKTWIRNPRAVKQTTWMPRIWYNSNSSAPTDAVRNEVEINAVADYLFANSEKYELAGQEPAARRREGRREDRQVDRLPGLPRRRRRLA